MTWFKFEKALKLLVSYLPEKPMKKPTLFHSVRVGTFLWNNWYSEDLQIAWLLHDALEDTGMPEKLILNNFWKNVLEIVQSNSKDNNLESSEILEDIVVRCKNYGEEAMIVKMADVYDNFIFYVQHKNNPEIKRCKTLVTLIEKYNNVNIRYLNFCTL
jgi:(p)ppGpp synthase/HD superfamily hydrolase